MSWVLFSFRINYNCHIKKESKLRVFIWIVIGIMAIIIMGDYIPEDKGIVYQVVSGIGLVFVAISVDKMIHRDKNN